MENLAYLVPIVFFAGIVRGYSGFGFAVIAVIGLNLFLAPAESVPIVLGLDFICSIGVLKQALKQAHIDTFKMLVTGSVVGIPMGLLLLYIVPANWLKLVICALVLVLVILLLRKPKPIKNDSTRRKFVTGVASGAGISSASIGGPMVLFYILSSPLDVKTQRATMILFFIVSDLMALIGLGLSQSSNHTVFLYLAWLLLPTLAGVKVGQYLFNKQPPKSFKTLSLPLMVIVAVIGLVNAFDALY
ncbi:sulfite exporter TauE/SafE family protein [Marinomonas sp. ef1]|jgi:uncharacterized protein|uniref:sulfite exporter TauE/SafE family protein n=1 Tax=Marinomonas sp. ef1 TaxID=2005043 RepID=UPI000C28A7C3|nr:sulfite exporter TauE/SafE family protein [Marinomonas sp. ef1]